MAFGRKNRLVANLKTGKTVKLTFGNITVSVELVHKDGDEIKLIYQVVARIRNKIIPGKRVTIDKCVHIPQANKQPPEHHSTGIEGLFLGIENQPKNVRVTLIRH